MLLALYSFLGSLMLFTVLAFVLGKRSYCSWGCGCGGLVETMGDPWRHLSDQLTKAWRFEQVSTHTIMLLAFGTTAVVLPNWLGRAPIPDLQPLCAHVCPRVVLKLETKWDQPGGKIRQNLPVLDL